MSDFVTKYAMRYHEIISEAFWNRNKQIVVDVAVTALAAKHNPFTTSTWFDIPPISKDAVAKAIVDGRLESTPNDDDSPRSGFTQFHVERIAYLVVHPDLKPLRISVYTGSPELVDGNHRLAAAIYRGDETIKIDFPGSTGQLKQWLGK